MAILFAQKPAIPKVWDDAALASSEVPLAPPAPQRVPLSAEQYYRMNVQPTYKSYPVYHPSKEPPGYMEWLKQQEPEIVFDPARLKTEADWIGAGEIIYDTPLFGGSANLADIRNPDWYLKNRIPVAADGTLPFGRYLIRKKGEIGVGRGNCAACHTRVLPDGSVLKGVQGNFPAFRAGRPPASDEKKFREGIRSANNISWSVPWLPADPFARLEQLSMAEIIGALETAPAGIAPRFHTSVIYPPQIPDLIGLRDRRYFDHTGIFRHRSIADLMRYAAMISSAEASFYRYGDFYPGGKPPDPSRMPRLGDEQLYALALYLYSLAPPPNPNKLDRPARRGQQVFRRERCDTCHTPPLYTNNKLTPVDGFTVPEAHRTQFDIMTVSVGTDAGLALQTRKATGYYKVPSLRGVWYRGPFEHNGSVLTLEDWFDPRRTRDDYVPTGFRGFGVKTRAVRGHRYGLGLSAADRKALIAFLKTL